ncbi:hypothetical protein LOD99_3102 [Oopsacas minuta]|uniref:Uncharacterized protein n=1 Tax=Oopsacas minuta TaxID=111878 RepID=A0AAV7JYZ6_9METZ|nr:hypothetical protein LOD99_3102 [Oopsacas minuta]
MEEYYGSEEGSIGEMSEKTDPAGLEDIYKAKQFDAVWKNINIFYEVLLDVIDNDSNTNSTTEATGYLLQIDRRFIRYLLITDHILKKAKFASDILQKLTNDLSQGIDLFGTLKDEIGACSSRDLCQKFEDEAEEVGNRLNLSDST